MQMHFIPFDVEAFTHVCLNFEHIGVRIIQIQNVSGFKQRFAVFQIRLRFHLDNLETTDTETRSKLLQKIENWRVGIWKFGHWNLKQSGSKMVCVTALRC